MLTKFLSKPMVLFTSGIIVLSLLVFLLILQQKINQPMALKNNTFITIEAGDSTRHLGHQLIAKGFINSTIWLRSYVKLQPAYGAIKKGTYEIQPNTSLRQLLQQLITGKEYQFSITFVEGTTFNEWLIQLQHAPYIHFNLKNLSASDIAKQLDIVQTSPEGWFFPDTYAYTSGTTALAILRTAHVKMEQELADAWQQRAPDILLTSAYQALVLASIIEKETGQVDEQPLISAVFNNRLRLHMRLQTDPTVIYGLGANYNGDLTKANLKQLTPYNTYKIKGLPPSPIAMPGKSALLASVQPSDTNMLYFVSQGNGRHVFSSNITDHNKAVKKYQLNK